jgi:serine phosphatase RsbU (regulator of sigma subunit)
MAYVLMLPSDGWSIEVQFNGEGSALTFQRNQGGTSSPIQSGDVLVAVGGEPIDDIVRNWITGRPQSPPDWAVGRTVTFVVERKSQRINLDVQLASRPVGTVLRQVSAAPWEFALLLVFAGIGLFVFLRAPRNLAARAMLLLGADEIVGLGVYPNLVGYPTPAEMFDSVAGALRLGLFVVFFAVYVAAWANLFVVFPTVKGPMIRYPVATTAAIYVGPVCVELAALIISLSQPSGFYRNLVVAVLFNVVVTFLIVVVSVVYSFRNLRDELTRQQLGWMVFAIIVGDVVPNLLGLFNVAVLQTSPVVAAVQIWISVGFPVAMAVAILRYRLYGIDVIVNLALVYGLSLVALGAISLGSLLVFQTAFRWVSGQTSDWAITLSTLVFAALTLPVRNRVQQFVDRRFFRNKYDAALTVAAFGASASNIVEVGDLARRLVDVVDETMRPIPVLISLPDHSMASDIPVELRCSLDLPQQDSLVGQFAANSRATGVRQLALAPPVSNEFARIGAELVVPMVDHSQVLALLILGPRRSGLGYSRDDRRLLETLATQAAAALRIVKVVREQRMEARRLERLDQDLHEASQIQQALLPQEVLSPDGWGLDVRYRPARSIGGDWYDFLSLPGRRIGIVVGDVTGSGVAAALLMASMRDIVRTVALRLGSPGAVLSEVNDRLCPDFPKRLFVACVYAILDPATGALQYASAGQVVPYMRSSAGVTELERGDLPLGKKPDTQYEDQEAVLEPGDVIVFHTDGLVDARNSRGEFFGFPRLARLIAERQHVADLPNALVDALVEFMGQGAELEDDLTLVVLQRRDRALDAELVEADRQPVSDMPSQFLINPVSA